MIPLDGDVSWESNVDTLNYHYYNATSTTNYNALTLSGPDI